MKGVREKRQECWKERERRREIRRGLREETTARGDHRSRSRCRDTDVVTRASCPTARVLRCGDGASPKTVIKPSPCLVQGLDLSAETESCSRRQSSYSSSSSLLINTHRCVTMMLCSSLQQSCVL